VKVSVVVPAYNEERLLPDSLRSIRRAMQSFTDAGWASELIVCDNNSTDRTAEVAAAAGAIVVFERVNQIARARNAGAAHASGDWLVFVDADSYPSPALFADVVEEIRQGRCIAGGATVAIDGPSTRRGSPGASGGRAVRAILSGWNAFSRIARWAAGSFIFCEAAAFRQVGGFDESYYAGEEIILSRRLKRLARRTRRCVVILHRHPLRTSARKAELYGAADAIRFYGRLLLTAGRSLRSREGAFLWYDGRR
jgi:glycosyltransferase involved in cell wall biosynthesis